jgi:hypothetical protein
MRFLIHILIAVVLLAAIAHLYYKWKGRAKSVIEAIKPVITYGTSFVSGEKITALPAGHFVIKPGDNTFYHYTYQASNGEMIGTNIEPTGIPGQW